MSDSCARKIIARPGIHLVWEVGKSIVVLKPHTIQNIKEISFLLQGNSAGLDRDLIWSSYVTACYYG